MATKHIRKLSGFFLWKNFGPNNFFPNFSAGCIFFQEFQRLPNDSRSIADSNRSFTLVLANLGRRQNVAHFESLNKKAESNQLILVGGFNPSEKY